MSVKLNYIPGIRELNLTKQPSVRIGLSANANRCKFVVKLDTTYSLQMNNIINQYNHVNEERIRLFEAKLLSCEERDNCGMMWCGLSLFAAVPTSGAAFLLIQKVTNNNWAKIGISLYLGLGIVTLATRYGMDLADNYYSKVAASEEAGYNDFIRDYLLDQHQYLSEQKIKAEKKSSKLAGRLGQCKRQVKSFPNYQKKTTN